MCGIAGFLHLDRERRAQPELLAPMGASLAHRGPDGEGLHIDGPLGLVHRRLAIIDLETGAQPMLARGGKLAVVLNGEIYNYLELRRELAGLGHRFETDSDTEVLLRSYEEWGDDLHGHLNGMWAFALWDAERQRLLLSRDRLGEKPLYYAIHDGTLLFGSEPKSLLAWGFPAKPNVEVTQLYLTFGWVPAPHTFYAGMKKLLAGCYLAVSGGTTTERRYWDLPAVGEADMLTDAVRTREEFSELLSDSVRIRMRADVAYGAFLSGGLDSSCVVSLMAGHRTEPVRTFTVGFAEEGFDERGLARLVADRFGTAHEELVISPGGLREALRLVMAHTDEPFGDSSAIAVAAVARAASKRVKMVLIGDGGDELLSGYNGYQSEKFAALWGHLPGWLHHFSQAPLGVAAGLTRGAWHRRLSWSQQFLELSSVPFADRLLAKASWAPQAVIKGLTRPLEGQCIPPEQFLADLMAGCSWRDPFYQLMYYHLKVSLPDGMLVKVDRMSMASALECRAPFLDHRLVELMARVHKNVKMVGMERKSLLRATVGRTLPRALLKARKRGFVVPLREWFRDDGSRTLLNEAIASSSVPLAGAVAEQVWRDNALGGADYGNFIWMLLLLGKWEAGSAQRPPCPPVSALR